MERTAKAILGAASIMGVPALGLPQISSLMRRMFIPFFSASPLVVDDGKQCDAFRLQNVFDFFHRVSDE